MARARELQIVRILECGLSADTSGFEQAKVFQYFIAEAALKFEHN